MKPYYEYDNITIFHGDCREKNNLAFGSIVTDPPYGISLDTKNEKYKGVTASGRFAPIVGDEAPFDPSWLLKYEVPTILWGANNFSSKLPDCGGWLAWIKTARDNAKIRQADVELAWTNFVKRSRVFHHLWVGCFKASESGVRAKHPSQKPILLMDWCISLLPPNSFPIFDPYMGCGSTLVAAKCNRVPAVGIEIDEAYCEIAAKRLDKEQPLDF